MTSSFTNKISAIQQQIEELNRQAEQYRSLESGLNETVKAIASIKQAAAEVGGDVEQDVLTELASVFGVVEGVDCSAVIAERDEAIKSAKYLSGQTDALEDEIAVLESRVQDWGEKYQLIVDERDKAIATISELKSDLERTVDEFEEKYSKCEFSHRSVADELAEARKRINQLEYEATLQEAEIELLRDDKSHLWDKVDAYGAAVQQADAELVAKTDDVHTEQEEPEVVEDEPELTGDDETAALFVANLTTSLSEENPSDSVEDTNLTRFAKGDIVELPDGRYGTIFHQESLANGEQMCGVSAPGGATTLHASSLRFIAKAEDPESETPQPIEQPALKIGDYVESEAGRGKITGIRNHFAEIQTDDGPRIFNISSLTYLGKYDSQKIAKQILAEKTGTWANIRSIEGLKECPIALDEATAIAKGKKQITLINSLPQKIAEYIVAMPAEYDDREWLGDELKNKVTEMVENLRVTAPF